MSETYCHHLVNVEQHCINNFHAQAIPIKSIPSTCIWQQIQSMDPIVLLPLTIKCHRKNQDLDICPIVLSRSYCDIPFQTVSRVWIWRLIVLRIEVSGMVSWWKVVAFLLSMSTVMSKHHTEQDTLIITLVWVLLNPLKPFSERYVFQIALKFEANLACYTINMKTRSHCWSFI